jgi:hypothetical protein
VLTTDPIYYKPLLPVITIKNTGNNATLYTYNSFTDSGTTDKVIYCSVRLSQNTFGEFTIQFEDQNKSLESTVTVGSRVQIDCGKQSGSLTRLISGLVRKKGYQRGANNKVLYTISGTSTGIRLNERLTYVVSEASKLNTGQINTSDASRKADTLVASGLNVLTSDGILSIANLAANSDVETFIPNTNIQYGELQDLVNYYEDQSGGEVIVDTTDLVSFRYEIKNNLTGRGFTIKNNNDNKANDDADDTMYLIGKNWTYEDDFYKSSSYANRCYSLLSSEGDARIEDYTPITFDDNDANQEVGFKFRPTHSHFLPGDIFVSGRIIASSSTMEPIVTRYRIIKDTGGPGPNSIPLNANGVVVNIDFSIDAFNTATQASVYDDPNWKMSNDQVFYNTSNIRIDSFDLDMTQDYWFLLSNDNAGTPTPRSQIQLIQGTGAYECFDPSTLSTNINGGVFASPHSLGASPFMIMPRRRSHSFFMYDPKAMQAVSSGLTAGLATDTLLTDAPTQVTSFDSMYRYIQQQTYNLARPRTVYNFPKVSAPNIPPFPGDPIIISDSILGFSTSGNQVVVTTCGDMTYSWGNVGSGSYEAPTNLSINAIGIHARYR